MFAVFALATSLLWGLADFGGGLLARRAPALSVVVASQALATAVLGALVLATGGWSEAGPRLWFAVAAGFLGPTAILSFYRALAIGPMGLVSPLVALGSVVVPVAVGLALGERLGPAQAAGSAVAVAGVVLAGGSRLGGAPVHRRTLLLSLTAALSFGTVIALVAEAATTLTGLFLALFTQRLCNVAVGGAALWAAARRGGAVLPARGARLVRALPALAFVGLADVAANGTYNLAARHGPVTVAAVLASLYPVVTAFAARGVLGERLHAVQAAGAGLALAGSVLLAAG
ncbi:EamA family transporter [Streptomyces sp. B1866]|uniref:EamA family transporter n=1 Tax=Streptomyces sp. B1866 TaxID=3075431 RepID=UPI00288E73ED|nr:EamA family transporter [Streptomyces sp. B1866]MDT3399420.1 EamA family transporter [Streptomyces sp. B1866]